VSPSRLFRITFRLGLVTTLVMFALIVVGSVVRTTGSGLACPDWPLCQGRLIPPFQFNVTIEWFHRLLALIVSVLLATTVGWIAAHRRLRARLGGLAALAVVLLASQVLLGALTVWKLLDPGIVSGHLAVALLLFSTFLTLTLVSGAQAEPESERPPRPAGLLPTLGLATVMTYAQALLGGMVSTRHAGVACPDWPTCFGAWFPPLEGAVGLQMMHRYGAYALTAMLLVAAARARLAPDEGVRRAGLLALGFTVAQVVMGVCNVFLATPVWLSALHLATAVTILALLVTATFRAAALPATATGLVAATAP